MLCAIVPDSYKLDKVVILYPRILKQYVDAEYARFQNCLKKQLEEKAAEAKGNTFCQFLRDGVTLCNNVKYQALGMQFVNDTFHCNHVVTIAFRQNENNTGDGVSKLGKEVMKEVTGHDFKSIFAASNIKMLLQKVL